MLSRPFFSLVCGGSLAFVFAFDEFFDHFFIGIRNVSRLEPLDEAVGDEGFFIDPFRAVILVVIVVITIRVHQIDQP